MTEEEKCEELFLELAVLLPGRASHTVYSAIAILLLYIEDMVCAGEDRKLKAEYRKSVFDTINTIMELNDTKFDTDNPTVTQ